MDRNEIPGEVEIWKHREEAALERAEDKKEKVELNAAKERASVRLAWMTEKTMDAIEAALTSEDEAIRVKTAMGLLDRLVPKVGVERPMADEVVEVIPDSRKRLLDDVEAELRRMHQKSQAAGAGAGAVTENPVAQN